MIIVITGDCHGRLDIFQKIAAKHPDADMYIDTGDSEGRDFQIEPFISVRGNCDSYIEEHHRIIECGGLNAYVFHGDYYDLSDESLYNKAVQNNCGIIIHGHTHIPKHHIYCGIHIICPGSPILPRSGSKATYVVLEKAKRIFVRFYEVKYEKSK